MINKIKDNHNNFDFMKFVLWRIFGQVGDFHHLHQKIERLIGNK